MGQDPEPGMAELLERTHQEQLALCDSLEAIADSLPDEVDPTACLQAARAIGPLLLRAHAIEQETIFPALAAMRIGGLDLLPTIERLKLEHYQDECFAEELSDVLMSYGRGLPQQTANATGYMLRGFFDGLRRHVAFERELFGPLIRGGEDRH